MEKVIEWNAWETDEARSSLNIAGVDRTVNVVKLYDLTEVPTIKAGHGRLSSTLSLGVI